MKHMAYVFSVFFLPVSICLQGREALSLRLKPSVPKGWEACSHV